MTLHPQFVPYVEAGFRSEVLPAGRPDQPWREEGQGHGAVLPPRARGKVPAWWRGRWEPLWQWQDFDPARLERTALTLPEKINVSLRCDRLIVIDCDFHDASVNWVADWLRERLPEAAYQTRGDHRHKLVLYADPLDDGPSPDGLRLYFGEHAIEILAGGGRQFIAEGMHPDGDEYEWADSASVLGLDPAAVISGDSVAALFGELEGALEDAFFEVSTRRGRTADDGELTTRPIGDDRLMAPSADVLRDALMAIGNEPGQWHWDAYVTVCRAAKAACGGSADGLAATEEWAALRDDYDNDDDQVNVRGRWRYMESSSLGWSWLEEMAMAAGWEPPGGVFPEEKAGALVLPEDPDEPEELKRLRLDLQLYQQKMGRYLPATLAREFAVAQWRGLRILRGARGEGKCFLWDEPMGCWAEHSGQVAEEMLEDFLVLKDRQRIAEKEKSGGDGDDDKKTLKPLAEQTFRGRTFANLKLRLPVDRTEFDRDPVLLNTPAGVLDPRTGAIRPRRERELFLKRTAVAPAEEVSPLLWETLLAIFDGDRDTIDHLQKCLGRILLSLEGTPTIIYLYGQGGSGKSMLAELVTQALGGTDGAGYAGTLKAVHFLMGSPGMPEHLAAGLHGKRLVTVSEIPSRVRWNDAEIKRLSSSDTISGSHKFEKEIQFRATHTLLIHANNIPALDKLDEALTRRLHIIPFPKSFSREGIEDTSYRTRLAEPGELASLLRFMVDGAIMVSRDGLPRAEQASAAIRRAYQTYALDQDPVEAWLTSGRLIIGPGARSTPQELFTDFRAYCDSLSDDDRGDLGLKAPQDARGLSLILEDKGYPVVKSNGARYRQGLAPKIRAVS